MSRRLGIVVFVAGGGTLSTEISASRLLAPYFGSSTVVWANIIGLILVYLSVGYWLGGKLADRLPIPALLGAIVLVSAAFIAGHAVRCAATARSRASRLRRALGRRPGPRRGGTPYGP